MKAAFNLSAVLFGLWLVWSGHYTPLLIGFGLISCLGTVLLCHRMGIVDREALPLDLTFRTLRYIPWLTLEVIKSNLDLAWRVLQPNMPISPSMIEIEATQKTDLGLATLANSITLTPSTVTIDVSSDGRLVVHAVADKVAQDLLTGEMDRRVTVVEGDSARFAESAT
ncbi:MAG: Na+/H+ antiporter subunit E [Acidobacteriota bacterium]